MMALGEVKKEKKVQQIKREGGLYKKLKIPTLSNMKSGQGVAY